MKKGLLCCNKKIDLIFVVFFLLCGIQNSMAEKVVLQLKWEHEFQFAGYYAALWQGYYEERGIDAELRSAVTPDQEILRTSDEVIAGRADFGIGGLDILAAIDHGEELLILAPIFQKSPNAIITLDNIKIESVNDLIGMRVGIVDEDYLFDETMSMFRFHGVDPNKINIVNIPPLVKNLMNGSVDAVITFGVTAEYEAKELGVNINLVDTSKFGTRFFGDVLYTRKDFYNNNPKLVNDFVDASLKGWEFALRNKPEMVKRISEELPRYLIKFDAIQNYNSFFSGYISKYIQWPEIKLGYLDYDRWIKIYNDLKYIGILENEWNLDDYILKVKVINYDVWLTNLLKALLVIMVLVLLVLYQQTSKYRYLMIFLLLAMSFAYYFFEKSLKAEYKQQLRFETLVELESIKSNLVGLISSNISLLKGFAAHISYNPDINEDEFKKYAEQVFNYGNALINFAAAPDFVVSMVYPIEGNEGVIGLDYTKNLAQIDSVLDTTYTNDVIMAGPLSLVQGGDAIIARAAIYERNNVEKFWGIISAPIDLKLILSLAGVFKNDLISEMAIQKVGGDEKIIHGNRVLFQDQQAVNVQIEVGDTVWSLHARPVIGWEYPLLKLWLWRLIPLILTLALFYFLYVRNVQRERSHAYKEAINRNERLLLEVGELAHVGGFRVGVKGEVKQWTAVSKEVLGEYFPSQIQHVREFIDLFNGPEANKVSAVFNGAIMDGIPFDLEVKYTNRSGQQRWVRLISDEMEKVFEGFEVTGAIQDITYYKNINELIEYQATHDTLTGLYNRYSLHEDTLQLMSDAQKHGFQLMALFIDIDDFKNINDSLGHHAGDQFLRAVANSLKRAITDRNLLARYSGDEFVAIVKFDETQQMMSLIQYIFESIKNEYDINGTHVICSCSVGVAVYPDHSNSIEDLVSKADMAMYSAKQKGKNCFEIYSSALLAEAERRASLKTALQHALIEEAFEVYFQPIVNLANGKIIKFEALLRWFKDNGERYNTEEFIAIAEEAGLVVEIDLFVLKRLNQQLCQLDFVAERKWGIAINVSPILFNSQKSTLDRWFKELKSLKELSDITIEITERSLVDNPQTALQTLKKLNEMHINVAIDDFGVGFSSLNYLTKFPIQTIKIDKSFTSQIGIDAKTDALIKTILSLATDLNMQVVAEGIETLEQYESLSQSLCQFGQGYLFSKAVPFAQACDMYEENLLDSNQINITIAQQ